MIEQGAGSCFFYMYVSSGFHISAKNDAFINLEGFFRKASGLGTYSCIWIKNTGLYVARPTEGGNFEFYSIVFFHMTFMASKSWDTT